MLSWSALQTSSLRALLSTLLGVVTNGNLAWKLFFVKKRELPWFQDYWLKTGPKPQVLQSSSESVSSEDAINNRKDKTHNPNLAHILFLPMVSLVF